VYEHLPAKLHAMKAKNPGMNFEYVPKPKVIGPEGRQYFLRVFWTFGQCVEAFQCCCDMLSIDGTFLMGKYEGTMLIAIGIDADHQLVPLAFAIVEKENRGSWGWFLRLVRRVVVGPRHEICVSQIGIPESLMPYVRSNPTTPMFIIIGAHDT
jgi:hypothetical protein